MLWTKWRQIGVWAAPALAGFVLTHAAWRAVAAHRGEHPAVKGEVGEKSQASSVAVPHATIPPLPSSPAGRELAAPAPGTTGTVQPPPEPTGAAQLADTTGATVFAARPFAMGHGSPLDRGRALECLTAAIYYESGNQSDDGERAVAQVVLNRVRHPAFPATVCGVVYQGSEHTGCQFSFACDGSTTRATSRAGWLRAMRIATDALAGQVFAPVGLATHYHTYAVTPAWNRALVMTDAVGAHFFHRWKGYWGTPAAFSRLWSGHEPEPGPHAQVPGLVAPTVAPVLPRVTAPAAAAQVTQPTVNTTAKLPQSEVLDRWKDSGKPLR